MIFGYAHVDDKKDAEARREDLLDLGAERVWVDYPGSNREERAALFENGLRRGTTLLLLRRADLGAGREPERFEALAADKGAIIEVRTPEKPSRAKPGPAPKFFPDYRQERRIRHYWHGPFSPKAALDVAQEEMGFEVSRNMLNKHLGVRSRPKPWINDPPEHDESKEES